MAEFYIIEEPIFKRNGDSLIVEGERRKIDNGNKLYLDPSSIARYKKRDDILRDVDFQSSIYYKKLDSTYHKIDLIGELMDFLVKPENETGILRLRETTEKERECFTYMRRWAEGEDIGGIDSLTQRDLIKTINERYGLRLRLPSIEEAYDYLMTHKSMRYKSVVNREILVKISEFGEEYANPVSYQAGDGGLGGEHGKVVIGSFQINGHSLPEAKSSRIMIVSEI